MPEEEEIYGDISSSESVDGLVVDSTNPFYPDIDLRYTDDGDLEGYNVSFNQGYIFNRVSWSQVQDIEDNGKCHIAQMAQTYELDEEHDEKYYVEVSINASSFLIESAIFTGFDAGGAQPTTDFPEILFSDETQKASYTGYYPVLQLTNGSLIKYTQRNNIFLSISLVGLITLGLIMVTSSSIYIADNLTGNPFHFATRQALFIGVGIFIFTAFLLIPSSFLEKTDWLFLLISILLLVALFIPGIGTEVNGSIRWIRLGPINIQPAEVCKFSMILYTSGYCVRRMGEISTLRGFLKPLMLLGLVSFLILSQPDLGTTAIICAVVVAILFFAGISFFQFGLLILLIGALGFIAIYFTPFRLTRVMSFMDPFLVQQGAGWQLSNSLIGIGQANWIGLGLGNSFQKNLFLPEAHTDFIFAVLVEELGIFGVILLISLYSLMIFAIFSTAIQSLALKRFFQGFVAFGIGFLISIQALFNLAVNIGLLPTKGLTLPFISYGGTSIIIMMSFIAIVLRINNENKFY